MVLTHQARGCCGGVWEDTDYPLKINSHDQFKQQQCSQGTCSLYDVSGNALSFTFGSIVPRSACLTGQDNHFVEIVSHPEMEMNLDSLQNDSIEIFAPLHIVSTRSQKIAMHFVLLFEE